MEAIGPGIWTLAISKGCAIGLPFLLGPALSRSALRINKELVYAFALALIILTLTPVSFRGIAADYLFWLLAATTVVAFGPIRSTKNWRIGSSILGVGLILVYIPGKALFGSFLVSSNTESGLNYRMYETPDMVAANTYYLEVLQPWGIFELRLASSPVRPYCNAFEYDAAQFKLIVSDTCHARRPD